MSFFEHYENTITKNMNKIENFDYTSLGGYASEIKETSKTMVKHNLYRIRDIYQKDKNTGNNLVEQFSKSLDRVGDPQLYLRKLNTFCEYLTELIQKGF
jgi:hypothetical protein